VKRTREPKQPADRALVEEAIRQELRERDLRMIRALLRKPMAERTHFLRQRLPNGGSCL
jgi:hypothetical protein